MWRRIRKCPEKHVYRTILHRIVYQCTRRHSDKDKNWQNLEKLDIKSSNKPFIKKYKAREPFKPNTSSSNDERKGHKCGGVGHLANNYLKKGKINEIVETEDHNDKEEESYSEKDTEESKTSESDEITVTNA
ncbi:hypothetical protein O181_061360 [Austropuccinia psidii MF-1]|uniref:Uncharacterized protein n=1 Tax=Austropuccinia psidii MF-1 TaxID=1389203 RepID=A0A9Q3EM80_9BASI|nr:hypothetical protein [Austropuccinia psidii MF-1]